MVEIETTRTLLHNKLTFKGVRAIIATVYKQIFVNKQLNTRRVQMAGDFK